MFAPGAPQTPQGPLATEGNDDLEHVEELPSFRVSHGLLSPAHQRFCQQLLTSDDLNATRAYMKVYPDAKYDSARTEASRLLANPHIQREVQRLMDERATVTGITADRVLLHFWSAGTADPRDLMEVRIGCCRHCWGEYHQYQYTDAELERAQADYIHAEAKRRKAEGQDFEPSTFHAKGGGGFNRDRQPNSECPECAGEGEPRHIIKDTRNLSAGAARLFGGIKIDKNGTMTVLIRDPLEALKKVGEHLGMWSDKLPGPQGVDPLRALLEELRGSSGTAAALPIVHDDPELRPRADIEDATPKATPAPGPAKPASRWKANS